MRMSARMWPLGVSSTERAPPPTGVPATSPVTMPCRKRMRSAPVAMMSSRAANAPSPSAPTRTAAVASCSSVAAREGRSTGSGPLVMTLLHSASLAQAHGPPGARLAEAAALIGGLGAQGGHRARAAVLIDRDEGQVGAGGLRAGAGHLVLG